MINTMSGIHTSSNTSIQWDITGLQTVKNLMERYYTPSILSFGIFANILVLYLSLRTQLREMSVSVYIAAIAVNDVVFILSYVPFWMHSAHHIEIVCFPPICQISTFLHAATQFISVWLIALLQFHTCVSIGHKHVLLIYRRRHLYMIAMLLIVAVCFYAFMLFTTGYVAPERTVNIVDDDWLHFSKIYQSRINSDGYSTCTCSFTIWMVVVRFYARAEVIFSTIIPYCSIAVFHVVTIIMLVLKTRKARRLQRLKNKQKYTRNRTQSVCYEHQMSVALLCVFSFVWLQTMTKESAKFESMGSEPLDGYSTDRQVLHRRVRWLAYIASFCIKLLLYIIFWSDMRAALLECVFCEMKSTEQNHKLVEYDDEEMRGIGEETEL